MTQKNKAATSQGTVPKGYRLKPSTHKLIKEVQRSLNSTQDRVISMAIRVFQKESGKRKQKANHNS